jgi:hypothetical protein
VQKAETAADAAYKAIDALSGNAIVNTDSGETIVLTDSSERSLLGLSIYGRTSQNGTPSPDAPVALNSVGDDGNITVKVGISETDGNPQTLTVSTPNGLPGIPVASGGNYTDGSGQQWICDEVDFEKGVYVQRVVLAKLTSTMNWKYSSSTNRFYTVISNAKADYSYRQFIGLCSHYPAGVQDKNVAISYINEGNEGVAIRDESRFSGDMGAFKAWLDANDVWVLLQAKEQRETALSAEQLAAFALLHTNCPNTTVFNDKNAGMEVKYVADAKWYIDQKFAELAAVLVNKA